jgi:hypothetical protein
MTIVEKPRVYATAVTPGEPNSRVMGYSRAGRSLLRSTESIVVVVRKKVDRQRAEVLSGHIPGNWLKLP